MSCNLGAACLALAIAVSAVGQQDVEVGALDPPALDGLKGTMGCVAHHLEDACGYALGYVVNGSETVVVLKEFQRRLASGQPQWLIVDVVKVPAEFSGSLESNDCRYGGAMMQPIVAAVSVVGEPGDWVGPADWVVVVDWEAKKLVAGDPRLVECWVDDV